MRFLESALERALGKSRVRVLGASSIAGGSIHEARRLDTSEGRFFAKWGDRVAPDIFLREAQGLEALQSAATGLVIPRVIAAHAPAEGQPALLILEFLPTVAIPAEGDDERLGQGLASLHQHRRAHFGFDGSSYCGATLQENPWTETWPAFYRDFRLRPLLERLTTQGQLTSSNRHRYERLLERLPDLLAADSVPSFIHGDLWSGNILWTPRGPALVDPACFFAEREMEFGIGSLFGGLSDRAMAAYHEAFPLSPGWRERNPLYQLYHLLNHAVLFGGSYIHAALRVLQRFAP